MSRKFALKIIGVAFFNQFFDIDKSNIILLAESDRFIIKIGDFFLFINLRTDHIQVENRSDSLIQMLFNLIAFNRVILSGRLGTVKTRELFLETGNFFQRSFEFGLIFLVDFGTFVHVIQFAELFGSLFFIHIQ